MTSQPQNLILSDAISILNVCVIHQSPLISNSGHQKWSIALTNKQKERLSRAFSARTQQQHNCNTIHWLRRSKTIYRNKSKNDGDYLLLPCVAITHCHHQLPAWSVPSLPMVLVHFHFQLHPLLRGFGLAQVVNNHCRMWPLTIIETPGRTGLRLSIIMLTDSGCILNGILFPIKCTTFDWSTLWALVKSNGL